jgi:membrane-associated phospholipid phosphatase
MLNKLEVNMITTMQKIKHLNFIKYFSLPFNTNYFIIMVIILRFFKVITNNNLKKLLIGILTVFIIKNIYKRPRPYRTHKKIKSNKKHKYDIHSFPSGHSFISFIFIKILTEIYPNKLLTLLPFLVGLSRIKLGVHYPSDVMGGFILGFIYNIFYDNLLN